MTLVEDRPRLTPQAEAEGWLAAFEAALQSRDAAAAAALFLADGLWRDVLAFTWNIQTMAGRPAIEATLRRDACPHQAREFPDPAETNAAAPGQPRRQRMHRGDLRIRDGVWPG